MPQNTDETLFDDLEEFITETSERLVDLKRRLREQGAAGEISVQTWVHGMMALLDPEELGMMVAPGSASARRTANLFEPYDEEDDDGDEDGDDDGDED